MRWPDNLAMGPIREWPGEMTFNRKVSPFRNGSGYTPLSTTLEDFSRELRALNATDAEMLIALDPSQFRLNGKPYANAVPTHPGIIITFTIPKIGEVSYPCDTFTMWHDNLRAVVLALEALRKVDRYGVTKHGEQYRGFLALEATAMPAGFRDVTEAMGFITNLSGIPIIRGERESNAKSVRRALRAVHPDSVGGDASRFQRATLAEAKLRDEGLL